MIKYELPISPNYVSNWGIKEAIRELLQNAVDGEKAGYEKRIFYDKDSNTLTITNFDIDLKANSLILGCSSKTDQDNMIGKYGEGYKLALVVLLRKGMGVVIENGNKIWIPTFDFSETFGSQVLTINEKDNTTNEQYVSFHIQGITNDMYDEIYTYFPCIDNDFGETVECNNGQILLEERFKGRMFVEGLFIQSDENFDYGYNFSSDVVELDRDRKAINYYQLRTLTAESIVTAEECHPKLFKAISNSCTDVKDIIEVLDEANDRFLQEYRDALYEEKNLEEGTLIATESVMKQLQQMDIDIPVAKGTEVESYLIAKANDKLGLIEDAKDELNKKSEEERSFDSLILSDYRKMMEWFLQVKKYLPKKWKDKFLEINRPGYSVKEVIKYIPDDFDYTIDSCEKLKEDVLTNQDKQENEE